MEQLIGQSIGDRIQSDFPDRYQIQALLGKQTGRRTFLAQDAQTGSLVVIKLILFGPDFTWEDLKLFEREAETLKSLDHPAIPKYLDSFEVETALGQGFALVQTYIKAKSLQEWVSSGYTFSDRDLRGIASGLLRILEYLHHRQPPVIHRDIKPSNILLPDQNSLTREGIYLVDFGSVQTAQTNGTITIVGTYGYMPPEQFGGQALPASDIYSLGATLIYLATGNHPAELMQADMQLEFDNSSLSEPLSHWLRQLTYADLARRIPSASQALEQLVKTERPDGRGLWRGDRTSTNDSQKSILKSNFSDLIINSTAKDLVIQLRESRVVLKRDFLRPKARENELSPESAMVMVVLMGLYYLSGHFAPSFSAVIVIAMLPTIILFDSFVKRHKEKEKPCQIILSNHQEGSVSLSFRRMRNNRDNGWMITDNKKSEAVFLLEVPLHSISTTSSMLQDRVNILFYEENKPSQILGIRGTKKEILWVCEHINRWGKCEIEKRLN